MLISVLMLLLLSTINISCIHHPVDSLDAIKNYNAENKYFKTNLRGLHFVMETQAIPSVDSLFAKVIEYNNLPVDPNNCADGVYVGETPADAFYYRHIAKLKIKDGVIVSIDYDEVKPDGHAKKSDETYNEEMSSSGSSPAIAFPIYEKQLLEKQNMMEVDAVSGASYSLYRFRLAVTIALMKARLKAAK
ncbi:hypothetical protein ACFL6H_10080 [Candidatus Latescibacterota bacterium]